MLRQDAEDFQAADDVLDHHPAIELLADDEGRVTGARGHALRRNEDWRIAAGAVILAITSKFSYHFAPDGFGGTLFFDSGNVWGDWRSLDVRELKNGVGLGARSNSPIGPLRAGIGWKLDREKGESGYTMFFNIGNAF